MNIQLRDFITVSQTLQSDPAAPAAAAVGRDAVAAGRVRAIAAGAAGAAAARAHNMLANPTARCRTLWYSTTRKEG